MSAAPLERPQSVNGLQWVDPTTDHLRQMSGRRPVVRSDPGMQYIPVSILHQPSGAGMVGLAPSPLPYQASLHATVANNLYADSRCSTSDVDSDSLMRSASQVTVRQSIPPFVRPKASVVGDSVNVVRTFSPANTYSVPVEVHRPASYVSVDCTGHSRVCTPPCGGTIAAGNAGTVPTGSIQQSVVTEFDPFYNRTIQRPVDAPLWLPTNSSDQHPDHRRYAGSAVGRTSAPVVEQNGRDPNTG